jgi:hypothetical protein
MPKPFVPAPNVARVEFVSNMPDNVITEQVVHLYNQNPPTTTAQMTALANTLGQWYKDTVLPLLSAELEYLGVVCRPQDSAGLGGSSNFTFDKFGGIPAHMLPSNCAVRIEVQTGVNDRWSKGYNYFSGIPETVVAQNDVKTTYMDLMVSAWADLIGAAFFAGWRWVVVSRFFNGAPRTTAVTQDVIGCAYTLPRIRDMGRRLY